jgi:DNA mismatch repair protein MutS2
VKLKKNYQVGEVLEIKGKRAIVKVGQLPMNIDLIDLMVVEKIEEAAKQPMKAGKSTTNHASKNVNNKNK